MLQAETLVLKRQVPIEISRFGDLSALEHHLTGLAMTPSGEVIVSSQAARKRDDHRRQQARLYDPGQVEARRSVVRFRYACGFRFRKDRAPGRSPFRF